MIIILPSLAILAGLGLYRLKGSPGLIVTGLIVVATVGMFRAYQPRAKMLEMMSYLEQHFQPNDVITVNDRGVTQQIIFTYYLYERTSLPRKSIVSLTPYQPQFFPVMPIQPEQIILQESDENLLWFEQFWGDAQTLWSITGDFPVSFSGPFVNQIQEHFTQASRVEFDETDGHRFSITEFRRNPEFTEIFRFGETTTLQAWRLGTSVDVEPCQPLTVESWWTADAILPDNYSLTLVLANQEGIGITNTDSEPAGVLTKQWQPGQTYLDERTVTVPCDASPGEYLLLMGLYDPDTLQALSAALPDGAPLGDQVYLTTVFVR